MFNQRTGKFFATKLSLSVAVALAAIVSTPASAFIIDTGNPDMSLRWDNTVSYGLGWRMGAVNPIFANHYAFDETETVFKKNDLVQNRLDVLSEADFAWKDKYGARVSAALWSENAYPSKPHTADLINLTLGSAAPPSNYGPSGEWDRTTKRYTTGSSGEFLDAFVYGGFELGATTLNVKLGQHNLYWGEALYTTTDGIAYAQGPMDLLKGQSRPGSQAKEIFMPINQISANWAVSPELSLMGQYMFDWKPNRSPAGGTFFGAADASECTVTLPYGILGGCIPNLESITPGKNGGRNNYGLAAHWTPGWLDGTAGFYYRKFDATLPWGAAQASSTGDIGTRLVYARDIELFGVSLGKNIGSYSGGVEFSYRKNTPLNAVNLYFTRGTATSSLAQIPEYNQVEGPRGNSFHVVANVIKLLDKTALYETGNMTAELVYDRLDKVTKYPEIFYSMDYACKNGASGALTLKAFAAGTQNKDYGCATKDSLAMSIGFNPQWMGVLPSVDLTLPLFLGYGLSGNSPVQYGSNEGFTVWSMGLQAIYKTLYQFDVSLSGMHTRVFSAMSDGFAGLPGKQIQDHANGMASVANGHTWLSLRFRTSF